MPEAAISAMVAPEGGIAAICIGGSGIDFPVPLFLFHGGRVLGDAQQESVISGRRATNLGGESFGVPDELGDGLFHRGLLFELTPRELGWELIPARNQAGKLWGSSGIGTGAIGEPLPGGSLNGEDTLGAVPGGEVEGGIKQKDVLRGVEHIACGHFFIFRDLGVQRGGQSAPQGVGGNTIHAKGEGSTASTEESCDRRIAKCGDGTVEAKGILNGSGLFQQAGDFELDGGVVGRIAGSDEELGARWIEFATGNEVARQFEANLAAAVVSIALPGTVERRLVVEEGLGFVALFCSEASQLEVDGAVAGRGFPESGEVDGRFLGLARVCERGGEFDLRIAAGYVRKGGSEVINGNFRVSRMKSGFTAGLPASAKFLAVVGEGAEQKEGEDEEDGGNEKKADEGYGIAQDEPPPGQPFFRGEDRARVHCGHCLYLPRFMASFEHLSMRREISNDRVRGVG